MWRRRYSLSSSMRCTLNDERRDRVSKNRRQFPCLLFACGMFDAIKSRDPETQHSGAPNTTLRGAKHNTQGRQTSALALTQDWVPSTQDWVPSTQDWSPVETGLESRRNRTGVPSTQDWSRHRTGVASTQDWSPIDTGLEST